MIDRLIKTASGYTSDVGYCIAQPLNHAPCHDFWQMSGILLMGAGLLVMLLLAVYLLRRQRMEARRVGTVRRRAERRREQDEAEVRQRQWVPDQTSPELTEAQIAARIRSALDAKKR